MSTECVHEDRNEVSHRCGRVVIPEDGLLIVEGGEVVER